MSNVKDIKNWTDSELDEGVKDALAQGLIKYNADGTFRLTDEGEQRMQILLSARPDLYSKIFPDRLI